MVNKIIMSKIVRTHINPKDMKQTCFYKDFYKQISVRIGFDYWEIAKIKATKNNETLKKYLERLIENDKN